MAARRTLILVSAIVLVAVAAGLVLVLVLGNQVPPRQARLAGDAGSTAIDAIVHQESEPAEAADVVEGLILTRLEVFVRADATVGQVNAALAAVDGTISAMYAELPMLTVAVPRQAGPDGIAALAATLGEQPGILAVLPARETESEEAPPAPANATDAMSHLQAGAFPAAWNARRAAGSCENRRVTVLVVDKFTRPRPAAFAAFPGQVPGVTDLGSATSGSGATDHGYNVTGTLAAKLDATVPTGANPYPECLDIRALQTAGRSMLDVIFEIGHALRATEGKVVVNASYGFMSICGTLGQSPPPACTPANATVLSAFDRALHGAVQRRILGLFADRVVVVSAAGNFANKPVAQLYPGVASAHYSSSFNVAAGADDALAFAGNAALWKPTAPCTAEPCFRDLTASPPELAILEQLLRDLGPMASAASTNVLVVGNIERNYQVAASSNRNATVYTVGQSIPVFSGRRSGTSHSAPQVAGLVAYLWMLSPDLRAEPAFRAMRAITGTGPGGFVNAYAAALSTDQPAAVTPSTAPIRLAVLDVDRDGDFDLGDLQAIHDAYIDSGLVLEPNVQDFSRFDLNGDGYTGGSGVAPLDLDPTGSTRYGQPVLLDAVALAVGTERTYDERQVTDAQAACYYANTALFTDARLDERDALVSALCQGAGGEVLSGTLTFTSHAEVPGVQYDVEYTITVVAEVVEGDIVLRTITGTGSDRYTYDASGTFNCAPGRPSETKTGTIDDAVGFRVADGEAGQVGISPSASGTEVSSFCEGGSWQTKSESDSFQLSSMVGTAVVVDGKTVAIDFNLDVTDEFGERRVTTGQLTRRACTFADGCGPTSD